MTLLAPAVIAVIQFAMYIQNQDYYLSHVDQNQWLTLNQNSMVFWSLMMMPLFVTLETALLSGLEYGRKNWTLLYTMPVPRWAFYAAKEAISMALIGISILVMWGFALLVGLILQAIEPAYGLRADLIPWRQMLTGYTLVYLAAFLIISIHLWVSSRWPSFVVALGTGIAATVTAVLIFQSDWGRFFPVDHARSAGSIDAAEGGPVHARSTFPGDRRRRRAAFRRARQLGHWAQGRAIKAGVGT